MRPRLRAVIGGGNGGVTGPPKAQELLHSKGLAFSRNTRSPQAETGPSFFFIFKSPVHSSRPRAQLIPKDMFAVSLGLLEPEQSVFSRSTVGPSLGQVLVSKSSVLPLKASPKARGWEGGSCRGWAAP